MIRLSQIKGLFSFSFKTKSLISNIPQYLIAQEPNHIILNTELPPNTTHLPAGIQAKINDDLLNIYWRDFCGFLYVEKGARQFSLISDVSVPTWARSAPTATSSLGVNCNKQQLVILDDSMLILYTGVIRLAMNPDLIIEIMNEYMRQNVLDYELFGLAIQSKVKQILKQRPGRASVSDEQLQKMPFGIVFADIIEHDY